MDHLMCMGVAVGVIGQEVCTSMHVLNFALA